MASNKRAFPRRLPPLLGAPTGLGLVGLASPGAGARFRANFKVDRHLERDAWLVFGGIEGFCAHPSNGGFAEPLVFGHFFQQLQCGCFAAFVNGDF